MEWTRGHTIGRGCSATVSIATASRSGEIFAVKSVELSLSKFLQGESKILSSLNTPYIVGYKGHDITKENNKLMYNLFMEYMPRGTLTDVILEHGCQLAESMIVRYTRQIVHGLEYLHSSGIVHCDIKGRNILIDQSGAKIADLGCAKQLNLVQGVSDHKDAVVSIGGTPMFMAPEVARGEEQGFPCDIWALGCTIIEMATGGSPWPNVTNSVSALHRIAFSVELPEFPQFLSDQARDFLSKCLRRDPNERWTAGELLKHPFLEEDFSFHSKQSEDFDTSNSPTSILDQGFWNSMEELVSPGDTRVSNTARDFCHCETALSNAVFVLQPNDHEITNEKSYRCENTHSVMVRDTAEKKPLNFPAERIRMLSLNSRSVQKWACDENWITVRSNEYEQVEERDKGDFGSVTASISHDIDLERALGCEDFINFSDAKLTCSKSTSHILMGCTCIQSVVLRSLNFERHKDTMLRNQTQFP